MKTQTERETLRFINDRLFGVLNTPRARTTQHTTEYHVYTDASPNKPVYVTLDAFDARCVEIAREDPTAQVITVHV